MRKFATVVSKLSKLIANKYCSEQTANQYTNIAADVFKVVRKIASGLTVQKICMAASKENLK